MVHTKSDHPFSLTTVFSTLLMALTLTANAAPMTDGKILDVLRTANNAEIATAEVASTNASSPKVREYADTILKVHKKNNSKADSLTKNTGLSFEVNDKSANLKSEADSKLAQLKQAPKVSKAFDKTYVDQQIAMHKKFLDDLNNNLIPYAQNGELKALLRETKSYIQHHLTEANKLQSAL